MACACADQEAGTGPDKSQNIGVSSNTGPDPLKLAKLPSQHSMLGHHRHASETPLMAFRWRADNGSLKVVLGSSLPSATKKTTTKNVVQVGPPLTTPPRSVCFSFYVFC